MIFLIAQIEHAAAKNAMGAANTISDEQVAKIAHDMSIPWLAFNDPMLKLKIPDGPNQFIRDNLRLHQQFAQSMYGDDCKLSPGGIVDHYLELRAAATNLCVNRRTYIGALPGDLQALLLRCMTAHRKRSNTENVTYLLGAPYSDCGLPSLISHDRGYLEWHHDSQPRHGRAPTLRALGINRPGRMHNLRVRGNSCVIGYIDGNYKSDTFGTTLQIEQLWSRAFAQ